MGAVILKRWCLNGPGYPKRSFFADNGGEFSNEFTEELVRRLNIKMELTPSYSPWSNGKCERKHAAIDLTIKKIIEEDPKMELEDALDHAVWARNCEPGRHGMSPYSIIHGSTPVIPGLTEGTVMSDSTISNSDILRKHFKKQELVREMYLKADASRRLKEALKSRIQSYNDQKYEPEDLVIFEDKDNNWCGPAKVKALEGKTVWILYNGNLRKVALCRTRPFLENDEEVTDEQAEESSSDEIAESGDEIESEEDEKQEDNYEVDNDRNKPENSTPNKEHFERRPTRGSVVKYKLLNDDAEKEGKVQAVGKKSTKMKDTCWIVNRESEEENQPVAVPIDFLKNVEEWKYVKKNGVNFEEENFKEPTKRPAKEKETMGVFLLSKEIPVEILATEPKEVLATMVPRKEYGHPEVQEAMETELSKWSEYEAYEEVLDEGQEKIPTRWVVNRKDEHDGLKVKMKARLCLRGDQEEEKPRSDSPTVDKTSTRILYAIAANEGWEIESLDVTSAFLQGRKLERDLFVIPPQEANCPRGLVWKMIKPAYGLYDASRRWWARLADVLVAAGCKSLVGDEALFYYFKENRLRGLLSLHVDDIQGAGTPEFRQEIMNRIEEEFKISKREKGEFKYTGVDVKQEKSGDIILSQKPYRDTLEEIPVDKLDDNNKPLTAMEFKAYRAASGKLTWLSEQTRPDVSYDVVNLTGHNKDATVKNLKDANKVIKKVKSSDEEIRYTKIGELKDLKILAISDASHLTQEEKTKGIAGRFIFLSDLEEKKVVPLLWKSKTIP